MHSIVDLIREFGGRHIYRPADSARLSSSRLIKTRRKGCSHTRRPPMQITAIFGAGKVRSFPRWLPLTRSDDNEQILGLVGQLFEQQTLAAALASATRCNRSSSWPSRVVQTTQSTRTCLTTSEQFARGYPNWR